MSQRVEFCMLALKPESKLRDLCHRFNISRRTGYKWLERYHEEGLPDLIDKSRRLYRFPNQTSGEVDMFVAGLRKKDPEWGAKKLHRILHTHMDQGQYTCEVIPCKNSITKILKLNGLMPPDRSK